MTWLLCTLAAYLLSRLMVAGRRYGGERYCGESLRWDIMRGLIKCRDAYVCCQCGNKASLNNYLQVHHKKHVADGGSYAPWNLTTLCTGCHREVHE